MYLIEQSDFTRASLYNQVQRREIPVTLSAKSRFGKFGWFSVQEGDGFKCFRSQDTQIFVLEFTCDFNTGEKQEEQKPT